MDKQQFRNILEENPIIAAIKSAEGLTRCLESDSGIVFILYGDLITLPGIVERIRAAGKTAIVHVDLVDGLSTREVAVDYIRMNTQADGIISTKATLVRYAKSKGLVAVQRFFILDSLSKQNIFRQMPLEFADAIEVLPGVLTKVLSELVPLSGAPVISGGLISCKEEVLLALEAGAAAISTTREDVWFL